MGPQIFKKIEDGTREFEDARLRAANTLKVGLDVARANAIAWANEPKYRDQEDVVAYFTKPVAPHILASAIETAVSKQ